MNELIAGTIAAPKDLPADAVSSVGTPNTLPADSAGIVGTPNTVPADGAGIIAAPISLPSQGAAALPRSLTPMVEFDFAAKRYVQDGVAVAFEDIFTYTRASSATFTNRRLKKNGGYEYFLDNDYVGNVTNLLTYSEDLTDADWNKTNVNVVTEAVISPFGGLTADRATSQDVAFDFLSQTLTTVTGRYYTVSFYVKAATTSTFGFRSWLNSGGVNYFKIITPTNEWQKVELTVAANGTSMIFQNSILSTGGVFDIYIWGAQVTESERALPYVKTLDVAVTKTFTETLRTEYDAATGKNLGALIEGGSTNLALHSEEFSKVAWNKTETSVLSNTAIAPDGTFSADTLIPNTSGNSTTVGRAITDNRMFQQTTSVTVSTNVANSIYVKSVSGSSSLLSIYVQVGDGIKAINTVTVTSDWQRIDVSADVSTGLLRFTICTEESVYIWGAQSEHLPFATSYIRTEGAAVSRSADGLTASGFSVLPSAGKDLTISVDASYIDPINTKNFSKTYKIGSTYLQRYSNLSSATIGGVDVQVALSGELLKNTTYNMVVTQNANITISYLDGNQSSTSAGVRDINSYNLIDDFNFGKSATDNTQYMYGHISKFSTYAQVLTAQEITLL